MAAGGQQVEINTTRTISGNDPSWIGWFLRLLPLITSPWRRLNLVIWHLQIPKVQTPAVYIKKNTFCAWKALGYSTSLQMNDNCCQTHFLSHSRWLNMASSSSVTVSWPEVPPLMLFSQHLSVCLPLCYHFSSTPISFHFLCRSPITFLLPPPPLLSRRLNQPVDKLGDKHTGCKLAWWLLLGRKAAWQPRLFTRLHASNLNSVPVSVPFESSINM